MEEKLKQIVKLEIYDRFKCSADQCPFTCCEDWEIDIDLDTYRTWEGNIEISKTLSENVRSRKRKNSEQHYIKMNARKTCPYLNSNQLCTLVIEQGEDYIPLTCRTFPRVLHKTKEHEELSLSCACPEVVDLLRELEGTVGFLDESNTEIQSVIPFDSKLQIAVIHLLRKEGIPIDSRIRLTFHMLQAIKSSPENQEEILEKYEYEQYLANIETFWKDNYDLLDSRLQEDSFIEVSELFLDIVQNYRRQPKYRKKLKAIAELAESLLEGTNSRYLAEYAKEYKLKFPKFLEKQEQLLANCIITKIFANCCSSNIDDMILSYQIIITEYVLTKYSVFLNYKLLVNDVADPYTLLRDYIVVYSRVIEYNPEGMKEFWAESFEEANWEIGYLLLLLG
jgi:lysine-N-methylase